MTGIPGPSISGGDGIGREELKKLLTRLADSEEQIARQTEAVFLSHVNTLDFNCEQAVLLATDLSLAACTAAWPGSAFNQMISRSVTKGLYLGLRESGVDFYESAYLTMKSLLNGAALGDGHVFPLALAASRVILKLAEQAGADGEIVLRKMASAALESYLPCQSEETAIENLFLEMFELVSRKEISA